MSFCTNCGEQLAKGQEFCSHCGYNVGWDKEEDEPAQKREVPAAPPKKTSPKFLVLMLLIIVIVAVGINKSNTSANCSKCGKFSSDLYGDGFSSSTVMCSTCATKYYAPFPIANFKLTKEQIKEYKKNAKSHSGQSPTGQSSTTYVQDPIEEPVEEPVNLIDPRNGCTIEEARDYGLDYAVLRSDGLVYSLGSLDSQFENPEPPVVSTAAGDKLITFTNDNDVHIVYKVINEFSPFTVHIVEDRNSDNTYEIEFQIPTRSNSYHYAYVDSGLFSEEEFTFLEPFFTYHEFGTVAGGKEIETLNGCGASTIKTYLDNNAFNYNVNTMFHSYDYYLYPGSYTIGYFNGTEYRNMTIDSSFTCYRATSYSNVYETYLDVYKTYDGYFEIDYSNVPAGNYALNYDNYVIIQ